MIRLLTIIFVILTLETFGQCGREYPSGFYHNSMFVTKSDTLNKLDSSGFYDGLHLYADNTNNLFTDTNSFIIGCFHHGLPIGEWKDYCKDGFFSIGEFSCGGGESSSDGKGGWITKKQGIYVKIGVWKYFDKDSNLIKSERYDRQVFKNGWANSIYLADSLGRFVLIKFESKYNYSTKKRKEITKLYTDKGVPVSTKFENYWRDLSYEYDESGQVSKLTKRRKLFGKYIMTTITKDYNTQGQVKCKIKTKCKHPDPPRQIINESW